MPIIDKKIKVNNPIYFSNSKTQALDEALVSFLEAIEEYATLRELSEEQLDSFKSIIKQVYLEKKASYFIEQKINNISNDFLESFEISLRNIYKNKEKEDINSVFYYNNKKRLVSNEQY